MKFYFEKKISVGIAVALITLACLGCYSWQHNRAFAYYQKLALLITDNTFLRGVSLALEAYEEATLNISLPT